MFTKEFIKSQLKSINAPQNSIVLVHSSLRSVGEVEGGGKGLLDALVEYFTCDGGLLCVPTHTWTNYFTKTEPTLDMTSDYTCIGALPTIAAGDPRSTRTNNPTHSMAVFGDAQRVQDFIKDEELCTTPTAPKGCHGKLCEQNGHILLIGVGHNRNTYLHCVEEMLNVGNRLSNQAKDVTVKLKDGTIEKRKLTMYKSEGIDDVSDHFPKFEPAFRYHNCIIDGLIGNASVQLCNARKIKEVMELIQKRNNGAELLADDQPLNKSLYK